MALPGRGEVRTRRSPSRAAGWSVGARLAEGGELRARDVGGALWGGDGLWAARGAGTPLLWGDSRLAPPLKELAEFSGSAAVRFEREPASRRAGRCCLRCGGLVQSWAAPFRSARWVLLPLRSWGARGAVGAAMGAAWDAPPAAPHSLLPSSALPTFRCLVNSLLRFSGVTGCSTPELPRSFAVTFVFKTLQLRVYLGKKKHGRVRLQLVCDRRARAEEVPGEARALVLYLCSGCFERLF